MDDEQLQQRAIWLRRRIGLLTNGNFDSERWHDEAKALRIVADEFDNDERHSGR